MKKLLSLFMLLVAIVTGAQAAEVTLVEYDMSQKAFTTGASAVTTNNVSIGSSSVKIHTNTDAVYGISFGSSIKPDGTANYLKLQPTDGFKAGDIITIAGVFNNSDDTKQAAIGIYYFDNDNEGAFTQLFLTTNFINGRTNANDPTAEQFTLTKNVDALYFGRQGNTGTHVLTLKVTRDDSRSESDLSVSTSASVNMNENTNVVYTTSSTGTVSVESADETIATATVDETTKTITITGVAAGTANITVSQAADDSYVAGEAVIEVEVIDPAAPVVLVNWNTKGNFTYTNSETGTVKVKTNTTTIDGIKFSSTTTETEGVYDKVVAVTVDGGFKAGDVVTIAGCYNNSSEKDAFLGISTDTEGKEVAISDALINGRLVDDDPTELVYVLQQDASVIYIGRATGSATTSYATKIIVTRAPAGATETISIPEAGVLTYVTQNPVDFSSIDGTIKAYVVTATSTTSATTAEVAAVPAGTPLLIKGVAGDYDVEVVESAEAPETNLLQVSDGNVTGGDNIYAYSKSALKFKKVAAEVTIPEGKCYLEIDGNGGDALDIIFDGEATGINDVNAGAEAAAPVKVLTAKGVQIGKFNVAGQQVK